MRCLYFLNLRYFLFIPNYCSSLVAFSCILHCITYHLNKTRKNNKSCWPKWLKSEDFYLHSLFIYLFVYYIRYSYIYIRYYFNFFHELEWLFFDRSWWKKWIMNISSNIVALNTMTLFAFFTYLDTFYFFLRLFILLNHNFWQRTIIIIKL